jgi:hypothetical protein
VSERQRYNFDGSFNRTFPSEDNSNSPDSSKSFGEAQLDVFHHRHGLLILHLLATMMFAPSVVAWFQVYDISIIFMENSNMDHYYKWSMVDQ